LRQDLERYVATRRAHIFGKTEFDEEDGWEREDGRPSEDDSTETESDGDFVLMAPAVPGYGGAAFSSGAHSLAAADLSEVPLAQRVHLLQQELRRRQAANRRILDENNAYDAESREVRERRAAGGAEGADAAGVEETSAGGDSDGEEKKLEVTAIVESFADRLRKMLAGPTVSIQLAIQRRLDELDAAVGLGPNAVRPDEEVGDGKGPGASAREGGGAGDPEALELEAELKRREYRAETEAAAEAAAEAAKLSSDIAEAVASPMASPMASLVVSPMASPKGAASMARQSPTAGKPLAADEAEDVAEVVAAPAAVPDAASEQPSPASKQPDEPLAAARAHAAAENPAPTAATANNIPETAPPLRVTATTETEQAVPSDSGGILPAASPPGSPNSGTNSGQKSRDSSVYKTSEQLSPV
jgi:hypothetical protein